MSIPLEALVGISPRRFAALFGPVLGKLPPVKEIPRPRLPRWKVTRLMVPATVAMLRRVNASQKRLPEFVAAAPSRCDQLRADIEQTTDAASLPRLWQDRVRPLIEEACDMLSAAAAHGTALVTIPGKLIARWTPIARDREAAKCFLKRALANPDNLPPHVFARDKLRSYSAAIRELQSEGQLRRTCRQRTRRYSNNRIESDHRHVKRRLRAMQGPRTMATACAVIAGIEAVQMIRKGQVLGITRSNLGGQAWVFGALFGLN